MLLFAETTLRKGEWHKNIIYLGTGEGNDSSIGQYTAEKGQMRIINYKKRDFFFRLGIAPNSCTKHSHYPWPCRSIYLWGDFIFPCSMRVKLNLEGTDCNDFSMLRRNMCRRRVLINNELMGRSET